MGKGSRNRKNRSAYPDLRHLRTQAYIALNGDIEQVAVPCPDCDATQRNWKDEQGTTHFEYQHDDTCPVLTRLEGPCPFCGEYPQRIWTEGPEDHDDDCPVASGLRNQLDRDRETLETAPIGAYGFSREPHLTEVVSVMLSQGRYIDVENLGTPIGIITVCEAAPGARMRMMSGVGTSTVGVIIEKAV